MSDTLITASWTHAGLWQVRVDKEWQLWQYSVQQHVSRASTEPLSRVDTGESFYQFNKLEASCIFKHTTKPDLIMNMVWEKRYLLLRLKVSSNCTEILRQLRAGVQVNLHPGFSAVQDLKISQWGLQKGWPQGEESRNTTYVTINFVLHLWQSISVLTTALILKTIGFKIRLTSNF